MNTKPVVRLSIPILVTIAVLCFFLSVMAQQETRKDPDNSASSHCAIGMGDELETQTVVKNQRVSVDLITSWATLGEDCPISPTVIITGTGIFPVEDYWISDGSRPCHPPPPTQALRCSRVITDTVRRSMNVTFIALRDGTVFVNFSEPSSGMHWRAVITIVLLQPTPDPNLTKKVYFPEIACGGQCAAVASMEDDP